MVQDLEECTAAREREGQEHERRIAEMVQDQAALEASSISPLHLLYILYPHTGTSLYYKVVPDEGLV